MVKLSRESLEAFQSILETVDPSWQTDFNLRETVRQSFDLIKKAKEHKVSWERIAEVLRQSSGVTIGISPESIRQYYFEFSKHPELLPKKKRKSSSTPKTTQPSPAVNTPSNAEATDAEPSAFNSSAVVPTEPNLDQKTLPVSVSQPLAETKPENSEIAQSKTDARSKFNLGRNQKNSTP